MLKYISTIIIVSLISYLFNFILMDYIHINFIITQIIRCLISFSIGYSAYPLLKNFDNSSIPYSNHYLFSAN